VGGLGGHCPPEGIISGAKFQAAVKKEVATHQANSRPIFYSRLGVPIIELPDGRCFEYRQREDGIAMNHSPICQNNN